MLNMNEINDSSSERISRLTQHGVSTQQQEQCLLNENYNNKKSKNKLIELNGSGGGIVSNLFRRSRNSERIGKLNFDEIKLFEKKSELNLEPKINTKYSKIRERIKNLNYFTNINSNNNNNQQQKNNRFISNNNFNNCNNINKNNIINSLNKSSYVNNDLINKKNSWELKTSSPRSSLLFPKEKDNNYVRIQVKYDLNDKLNIDNNQIELVDNNNDDDIDEYDLKNNDCIDTISFSDDNDDSLTIDYNLDILRNYNENPVDCPEEFLEQQQKQQQQQQHQQELEKPKENFKFKDYKDSIRDFLQEDWIQTTENHSTNIFTSSNSLHTTSIKDSTSKDPLKKITNNKFFKFKNNEKIKKSKKMGTVCSTGIKNHVLPVTEVNHHNVDDNYRKYNEENNIELNHLSLSLNKQQSQPHNKTIQPSSTNRIIQVISINDNNDHNGNENKNDINGSLLRNKDNNSLKNDNSHLVSNQQLVNTIKTRSSCTQTDSSPPTTPLTTLTPSKQLNKLNDNNSNKFKSNYKLDVQTEQQQLEQHSAIVNLLKNDLERSYSIELDNILHRSNSAFSNRSEIENNNSNNGINKQSAVEDNISYSSIKSISTTTTTTATITKMATPKQNKNNKYFKRNSAPNSIQNNNNNGSNLNNSYTNRRGSNNFFKNFSGSVQNLVYGSGRNYGKIDRLKSFSENNLTKFFNSNKTSKSQQNLKNKNSNKKLYSSNSKINDYCPSVLYNRKQIAENKVAEEIAANKDSRKINLKNIKKMFSTNSHGLKKSKSIQDTDGGFFEKFGSLLRQKSLIEDSHLSTPLAPLPEEISDGENEKDGENENGEIIRAPRFARSLQMDNYENDSGTETLPDSDSDNDPDPETKKQELIESCNMNIEELYEEVLHEILHNIGCETSQEVTQAALLEFIQDAFKITNDVHERILKTAETKEPPEIRLNVEIIKAENLMPKDSNGLSDPFVTMYLESMTTHRYNTSVKSATLSPVWEEHFSLPIPDNPNNEVLVLEVWDFDAAETVGEKMNKVFEVKGIKGFRKLMKEIAVTASTGKHDNELIGRSSIPLKSIPASGIRVWYSLEKNGKSKNRGSVLIHMSFSAEKNNRVAAQEHRHLLKLLLLHELETSQVAQYWWRGKFSAQAEAVLTQHSAQSGLSATDCAMAQWSVYAQVNQNHHLAFALFNNLLDKIIPTLQTLPNDDDEVRLFWEGAKRLLPSCFSIIRKLRQKNFGDKHGLKILNEVLDIMSKIAMLEPPVGTDLLPKNIYGWIVRDPNDSSPNWDLRGALRDSVNSGASEWFEHINEVSNCRKGNDEDQLQHLIKLTQLVRTDLQQAIEYYDRLFKQKMHFNYAQTLFLFYEAKLAEFSQPIVENVCKNIKRLHVSEDHWEKLPEIEEVNMGTTLFELYLVMKRFTTLGTAMCPGQDSLSINKYHEWFTTGVSHWLDISVYKALTRIEKAIDLDKLLPVDETVKYSSSAVDTLAIFYQIKIFWQQLGWPDAEGAYIFVSKIVDDICRCCVFYADRMAKRVEEINFNENKERFEVTREWCLAINNIDYIRQSLQPFIKELGADEIVVKIGEFRSDLEAQRCAETLKNVMENAIDTERNKIIELIEEVARKMSPAMRRFLTEGAEVLHEDSNSMDRLMMYLENSLATLNAELNEVNFERILDAIWCEISSVLFELVQTNLEKRRPPSFFSNLRNTLHVMVNSFKMSNSCTSACSDKETLENIERLLELHAYETAELIHQYYLVRLEDQQKMSEFPYGQLTVRGHFVKNVLHLEIMNARNLVPMDSDGSCDSFVKVHFMPTDKFIGVATPKTSTQSKTLYPLYDEKFTIVLSDEQRKINKAILVFSIKDKDYFGMSNQYIAEAYLTFDDFDTKPEEQILLGLSRPEYKDTDCLRALEHRQGDKQARDFLKKLKQKAY